MNNNEYKNAFSGVRHSDELTERIMNMTNKNKKQGFKKGLICALALLSVLLFGGLTANAASDGAVADAIAQAVDECKQCIRVYIIKDGSLKLVEPTDENVSMTEFVNEEGQTVKEFSVELPDDVEINYQIVSDEEGDGVEVVINGELEENDGELTGIMIEANGEKYCEPTTKEAE